MIKLSDMGNVDATTRSVGPLEEMSKSIAASVWDENDPRSVIRIVSESFREKMLAVPEDMRVQDESHLRNICKPTPTLNQVRLMFWLEMTRHAMDGGKFVMANAYRGVCTSAMFENYLANPKNLAFILCPPTNYTSRIYEALDVGLAGLRKILDYEDTDKKGKMNLKLLEMKMKITMYLDARVNGGFTQKVQIDQKSVNLNMDQKVLTNASKEVQQAVLNGDITAIDKRLHELEHKLQNPVEMVGLAGYSTKPKDIAPEFKIESETDE